MTLSTKLSNLTIKAFEKTWEVNLPVIEQLGKASRNQFKTNIKVGDELDFIMPPEITVSAYDGTLSEQKLTNNNIKIVCNQAWYYDFVLDDTETEFLNVIENEYAPILTQGIKNATEKFSAKREKSLANLITQSGFNLNSSSKYNAAGYTTPTTPIAVTQANVKIIIHQIRAILFDGQKIDGVPRSSWTQGKMLLYVPPAFEALLVGTGDMKYTELGVGKQIQGYIGSYAGFDIITTNFIEADSSGYYQIFACTEGETFGTIMKKNLTSEKLRATLFIGDIFRGLGIFGVGMVRRDKAATAYVSVAFTA